MPIRAVTFDVYSALFDTPAGLARALDDLFRRRGIAADVPDVLAHAVGPTAQAWRRAQQQYLLIANSLDREGASNRAAIEAAARYALRRLAAPLTPGELAGLVEAWERLPPWPETVEVLQEVRRRPVMLATLSNGDQMMLDALMASVPVRFDRIISTEGGKFKPHPSVYQKTLAALGIRAEELLHVAGAPADAAGATAAGIRTVWINRLGDAVIDQRFVPAVEAADLRVVPTLLPPVG